MHDSVIDPNNSTKDVYNVTVVNLLTSLIISLTLFIFLDTVVGGGGGGGGGGGAGEPRGVELHRA